MHVMDLPKDFCVNYIFNVEDVLDFKGHDFNPLTPLLDEPFYERLTLPPLSNILLIQQTK